MSVRALVVAAACLATLYACVGVAPEDGRCEAACAAASHCGLLPSALGGSVGAGRSANRADCVARCLASDGRTARVEGLLQSLSAAKPDSAALCGPAESEACGALIDELEDTVETSELRVTTSLTVRMTSAVSFATNFQLDSLCCFEQDDDGGLVLAVYDMFEPTYRCLQDIRGQLDLARAALLPEDSMQAPDPMAAEAACEAIRTEWRRTPPEEVLDLATMPCHYALMSPHMRSLGIPMLPDDCPFSEPSQVDEIIRGVDRTLIEWNLEPGGLLIDPAGIVRDADVVRASVLAQIDDEIERPNGFLEEACVGYDCDQAAASPTCAVGPLCNEQDCLGAAPACDTRLCDAEITPPSRDCSFFGITTITLGYRNEQGLEVLGEPIHGCTTLADLHQTFADVKVGPIVPFAVVSGVLPSSFFDEGDPSPGDGTFSWFVEGQPRWVAAGEAQLVMPSPLLEFFGLEYDDPLEYLGWVRHRLPTGQACDNQPLLCESYFNDNCADGLDNDGDGQVDEASAWCDELLGELASRCVLVEPGRLPRAECEMHDEGPPAP